MKLSKYILEISIFLCGAVVMIFELVGSRILAPYVGTSTFVWTSLIGTILASLSIGYYTGGKIADKKSSFEGLALIVFSAAIFIAVTTFFKDTVISGLGLQFQNIKLVSIVASFFLFCPASIVLGMISPYAAKLKIQNLENSGTTIGTLSALSTLGSIFGTFLAGFYLIPFFGTNKLLVILSLVLVLTSLLLSSKKFFKIKALIVFVLILDFPLMNSFESVYKKNAFIDTDTEYNRVFIFERKDEKTEKKVRVMGINNENHSSMFLDSDDLVNEYTKYYHLAKYFFPNFKKTLMFGGAAYSYPKDFLRQYPEATIDVVEIDPKVTALAKEYFGLKDDPRLRIFHEDARVYLNNTKEKYDVIFGDAFTSYYSVPYQLTTKEAVQKHFDALAENGMVILNLISALEGEKGQFFQAEYATYASIFPHVYAFPVTHPEDGEKLQNIILLASKSPDILSMETEDLVSQNYLSHLWTKNINTDNVRILTDDYAPVDYFLSQTL